MKPSKSQIKALKEKTLEIENSLSGTQVTWVNVPVDAPTAKGQKILFHGVLGDRRQYAFATEYDREQFVYNRNDALFTVSRDLRLLLGLSKPIFKGTFIQKAEPKPPKVKKSFRREKAKKSYRRKPSIS